jgi:hypothetical protein
MSRGFITMSRGVFDHPIFEPEPYTEREAWLWLIEQAVWRDTTTMVGRSRIALRRGQCAFSMRFLAEKWQWGSEAAVRRFLDKIRTDAMIDQQATRHATIITICNYDKYQNGRRTDDGRSGDLKSDDQTDGEVSRHPADASVGSGTENQEFRRTGDAPTDDQTDAKKKEVKEIKKEEDTACAVTSIYFFEAGVIRLTKKDFDKWQDAFPKLSLKAELLSLQEWAGKQPNWYFAVAAALNKRQRQIDTERNKPKVDANVAYWGPDKSRWGII